MKNTTFLILNLLLISCGHLSSETTQEKLKAAQFKIFLKKFKVLSLPFAANTSCYSLDSASSVRLDPANDSIFTEPNEKMAASVGMLPDTSNYYALIYCGAATCWMPKLAVYSKEGNLLSKEEIANGCGANCGYRCSDSLTIKSMSEITQIYTQWFYPCESVSKDSSEATEIKTDIIKYAIGKTGTIKSIATHRIEKR